MTRVVHVGGLGWSGSGAVLDALLDTGAFVSLKGKTHGVSESRLFSGTPSIPSLVRRLPRPTDQDILALWTAGTRVEAGTRLSSATRRFLRRSAESHKVNRKAFLRAEEEPLQAAAASTAEGIAAARGPSDREDAYLHGTYGAMRDVLRPAGPPVLIDNDPGIGPRILRHLGVDDRTTFIAVIRDPGDQYVDKRAKVDAAEPLPLNIVRSMASAFRRRGDLSALASLAERSTPRLFVISFERFVRDDDYRLELVRRVAPRIEEAPPAERRFQSSRSARNIGLSPAQKDRVQHAIHSRMCAGPFASAARASDPQHWPGIEHGSR